MQSYLHNSLIASFLFLLILSPLDTYGASQLTSSSGFWSNTSGGPHYGDGTQQLFWGIPFSEEDGIQGMSSYNYTPTTTPADITINEAFKIGTFTHINQMVFGTSITKTTLNLGMSMNIAGVALNDILLTTEFFHDETQNGGSACCDDLVTMSLNENSSYQFTIDSIKYNLQLLGFYTNNTLVNSFITPENRIGVADLIAVVTAAKTPKQPIGPPIAPPTVVNPEPETYLILGGALFFVLLRSVKKRRRKPKAKLAFIEEKSPTFFLGRFWKR